MQNRIIRIVSTVFGIGYLPIMPGTFASLAGVLLYCLFLKNNAALHICVTAVIAAAGFAAAGRAQRIFNMKDPGEVVIDELCGMLATFILIPFSVPNAVLGFILFRIFDIIKVYPIDRLERVEGAAGIMLDDIAAGVFANIALRVVIYLRIII